MERDWEMKRLGEIERWGKMERNEELWREIGRDCEMCTDWER